MDDIVFASEERWTRNLFLPGLVILLYDHILTFPEEVRYIWVPQHKRSSAWFLFIRYLAFFGNIVMAVYTLADFNPQLSFTIPRARMVHCTLALRVLLCLAAAWEADLACNIAVLGLTLYRAYKHGREAVAVPGSLWTVVIRDVQSNTAGGLSWCTAAVSVTMIARLMLNLHEAAAPPEGSTHTTNLESIRFAYSRTVPEDGLESGAEAGEEEI
ncbi:hypothetical protein DFH06DRAFT_1128284 [Mycena polygramma]|nr:hypothetical protein DFH06DRAFT_1128284 [Mycena polygramma]